MATIQIEVSPELAERLQQYRHELPRLLEMVLRDMEHEAGDQTSSETLDDTVVKGQLKEVLRESGAAGPSAEAVHQYLRERVGQEWTPLAVGGQAASEMIIEERKSRSWEEA